jgi:hypothetical protein
MPLLPWSPADWRRFEGGVFENCIGRASPRAAIIDGTFAGSCDGPDASPRRPSSPRSLPSYRARSHRVGSGAHPMHPPRARVPAAWTHPSPTRSACVAGPRTRRRRLHLTRTLRRWLCRACRCMPAWASAPGMRWMRARSGTLLRVHVFCAISLSPEDRRHRNRIGDLNTFDRLLEGFANWLRKSCLACSLIYLSVNAHITRAQVLSANLRGDRSLR